MNPVPIKCPFCKGLFYFTGDEMTHECSKVHQFRGVKVRFSWTVKEVD